MCRQRRRRPDHCHNGLQHASCRHKIRNGAGRHTPYENEDVTRVVAGPDLLALYWTRRPLGPPPGVGCM